MKDPKPSMARWPFALPGGRLWSAEIADFSRVNPGPGSLARRIMACAPYFTRPSHFLQ
jgi:hypothetical protein